MGAAQFESFAEQRLTLVEADARVMEARFARILCDAHAV